jgi:CheY-like chemotaxis protein
VDDEPDMTTLLKISLESAGFMIDTFNDPLQALENFKGYNQLDIMMPKMDGFDLYNKLKAIDHDIKICFLTASNETRREELLKQKHCEIERESLWEKPLPINEIATRINKQIGSP